MSAWRVASAAEIGWKPSSTACRYWRARPLGHDHLAAAIAEVLRLGVALRAVAQHGDCFAGQQRKVGVFVVVDFRGHNSATRYASAQPPHRCYSTRSQDPRKEFKKGTKTTSFVAVLTRGRFLG